VERKVATVLFADLVDSTGLGEGDPEQTRALLERFYAAMAEEVEQAGGTVEKFAGDAVMAAFGAPVALEDHAERALHAALAMQRRLPDGLAMRIGVNTGEVVVDEPHAGSSWVSGDVVNVCARLEQNADPGEVVVGERTAQMAGAAFEFDELRRIEVKGKREPIACRRLLRALSLMRPRGIAGLPSVFAGRDGELGVLRDAFEATVTDGRPQLVTIVGDAGVGKSRLVRELWADLGDRDVLRRVGRCLAYGSGITYWPIREILQEELGLRGGEEKVLEQLGERQILGLALGLDVAGDLHPLAARDRLRDAWISFVEELASARPVVLVIEDVHWAEPPLLELIERTAREARGPILLLTTQRPELEWSGGRGGARAVVLEPLGTEAAGAMLAALPAEARELVVARGEGNPFFVEELTAALIDRGVLERENGGGWRLSGEPLDTGIPDSVHGVLAARIDLLPAPEKSALQAAAVIGRVFWDGPVRELIGHDADLALLEERDFVRRRGGSSLPGQLEYAIKHALTREIAYASIPRTNRAQLHASFADWIERGEQHDEVASLLAHHYAESVRPENAELAWVECPEELARLRAKALAWLQRAAAQSMQRYELEDAFELLGRALPLAETRADLLAVHRATARAHAYNFAGEPFWESMQLAIAHADDEEVKAELYAEIAFESALRSGIWQQMPKRESVDTWVDRALEGAPPGSRARAMALIARARWNPGEGADASIEASRIAEALDDPALRSAAWDSRGIVSFVAGEFDHGRAWAERRFELLDRISDPDVRADIHAAPISGCIWSGRFREARRLAQAHDEITVRLTPHHRLHGVAITIEVEELLGRWDVVRGLQERTELAVEENLATPCVRNPRVLLVSAVAHELGGNRAEAESLEQAALDRWMEGYGATLDTPRVRLALARGDLDEVARLLELPDTPHGWHRGWFVFANVAAKLDALAVLGRRDELEDEAPRHARRQNYLRPFALRALGRVRGDEALVREALAEFEAYGLGWFAAETRATL
jgi:class 3 adenylate cyclase